MEYYDSIASSYDELHGQEQIEKALIIKGHLRPSGLLLDVGAGTGIATRLFEDCCDCIALDPSRKMLSRYNGKKLVGRAEELPFKDAVFDCVISISSLHHCRLKKAISELLRVAKPDAKIGISFFKRAKNLKEAKRLLHGFERIDSRFDVIFLRR